MRDSPGRGNREITAVVPARPRVASTPLAVLAVALLQGCVCGGGTTEVGRGQSNLVAPPVGPGSDTQRKHYSENLRPQPDPPEKLPVGADCTVYKGNSACASGLCLRVTPGSNRQRPKGFCSVRCSNQDRRCPDGWKCTQTHPGRDGWLCAPPKTFTGGAATYLGGPVPLPPPRERPVPDAGTRSRQ
jgi:hypothetical protein